MSETLIEVDDKLDRLLAVLDKDIEHIENCLSRLGELRCLVIKRDDGTLSRLLENIRLESDSYAHNDSQRRCIRRQLADDFGVGGEQLTLSVLENLLPAHKRPHLTARKAKLRSLVDQLKNEYASTAMLISNCARINSVLLKGILEDTRTDLLCYDAGGTASRQNDTAFVNMRL